MTLVRQQKNLPETVTVVGHHPGVGAFVFKSEIGTE